MIDERLVELAPSFMPALCVLLALMAALALWLLAKGHYWTACLLMAYPVAVALAAVGLIR